MRAGLWAMSKWILMGIGALVLLVLALKFLVVFMAVLFSSIWGIFKLLKVVIVIAGLGLLLYCLFARGKRRSEHARRYL